MMVLFGKKKKKIDEKDEDTKYVHTRTERYKMLNNLEILHMKVLEKLKNSNPETA